MTATVTATTARGNEISTAADFPAELDPRFDFAKSDDRLAADHVARLAFAANLLGGSVTNVRITSVQATPAFDPNIQTVGDLPERMTR